MQDQYWEIGETAGKIYKFLEQKGESRISSVQNGADISDAALFNQALGWLAREDKINFAKNGKVFKISLAGQTVQT